MHQIKSIIPLSLFKKNTKEFLSRIELLDEPIMLTLHGRGAFVIQHLNSFMHYAELAQMAMHQRAVEGMFNQMDFSESGISATSQRE